MKESAMNLSVFLPTASLLKEEVNKVNGESTAGEFCLKPKHIDYVTDLTPGIFSYVTVAGKEYFLAMDQGILVKQGNKVTIATRRAVSGELGMLFQEVEKMLLENDERERQNRSAMAKLEVGFLKNFLEFSRRG
jgi:F-type H+-transporting ATPase subunit epsilon